MPKLGYVSVQGYSKVFWRASLAYAMPLVHGSLGLLSPLSAPFPSIDEQRKSFSYRFL